MEDFEEYLFPGFKGHLVGIGGVSMSSLAEVLLTLGVEVTGSDMNEGGNVISLRAHGIKVYKGHSAENIAADVNFLVRTAAVHDDNPEIIYAREHNIPVFERTQAWGAISRGYKNALCISGTHGKTTTTSMCTHIFMAAEEDPTVMIGGTLPILSNEGHHIGSGETIIMESCEYYNSFLSLFPTVAVVLNIEEDHLDFFRDLADVEKSFRAFAERTPKNGYVILNADDKNTMDTMAGLDRRIVTFGMSDGADVYPANIRYRGAITDFDIMYHGELLTDVSLKVPGEHNVKNALAAAAAAVCLDIRPASIKYGLSAFTGAHRRFEFKGKFNGADVYDDYAHHPSELHALLTMVRRLNYNRMVVVFQPHTFTRTYTLFDSFVRELQEPDVLLLAEIFAAREKNTIGISSADLAKKIEGACFIDSFDGIETRLREIARPGDIILTVGAGDVYRIGENFLK